MPHHSSGNGTSTAADFLARCFAPDETIALLVRREAPNQTLQRIVLLKHALAPRYLSWLVHENSTGASIYVAANPLRPASRKRTKECIAAVRHLYLDLDTDGEARLTSLRASDAVPPPNAVLSTSLGKYQILWRVDGFTLEQQESALKLLAITFGGDPACTDCNRVLRLPGFLNQKYDPAQLVTVEYGTESVVHSDDFQLANPAPSRELIRGPIGPLKPTGKHSNSESDWVWILGELARGKDPVKLTRTLAERRSDKPNPNYYARRTVDLASAWLWLREGLPIADVVTMLQVRRRFQMPDKLCSSRAHEIAFTAQRMIARKKIA